MEWPPAFFAYLALTIVACFYLTFLWYACQSREVIIDPGTLLVTEKLAFFPYRRLRQWTFIDFNSVLVNRTIHKVSRQQKTHWNKTREFYSLRLHGERVEIELPMRTNQARELELAAMSIAALGFWKAYRRSYALGTWRGKNNDEPPVEAMQLQEITRLRPAKQQN